MSANVNAKIVANAPREAVWKVLADFSNIADYTDSVKTSVSTSEATTGSEATRHCDLAPFGSTEERVTEFVPNERLGVLLYDVKGLPVKESNTVFSLKSLGEYKTELTMSASVRAKGGILSGMIGKRLEKRLPKGAKRLVSDLAAAAEKIAIEVPAERSRE